MKQCPYCSETINCRDEQYALCVGNKDCEDLEVRKVYRILNDAKAEIEGYIRVIDESGEDYLYPASCFVSVELPLMAQEALASSNQ